LQELHVENFKAERDANGLRAISALRTINDQPVAKFWQEVDENAKK